MTAMLLKRDSYNCEGEVVDVMVYLIRLAVAFALVSLSWSESSSSNKGMQPHEQHVSLPSRGMERSNITCAAFERMNASLCFSRLAHSWIVLAARP